jgi:hypothetical protein
MDNKVCFIIANKYIKNCVSFIDYYVSNIQKFYKDSLIIIVDNNSEDVEDILERLKPYENKNLIFLTNNTQCKFELGGYKVGISYILDNKLLNNYDYYIFTQDTFVLTNKYNFNNLSLNNTLACSIKGNQTSINNDHYDSFFTELVTHVLKKINLEERINELQLCWANSFVLHVSKIEEFNLIVSDINIVNKYHACECERFFGGILFTLNNNINTSIENIYNQEEIHPHLWHIDIPNTKTSYFFTKRLSNKH